MKINYKKLNEATNGGYFRPTTVLMSARKYIEFLYTHNKNYTKSQWEAILDLKEIIDNIEE